MCSKDKVQLVRELVNNGSLQQYMFHHDEFTKSELYEIFYILKKMGFRVFEGDSDKGKIFCNVKEYMTQNNFHDGILTTDPYYTAIFCADPHLGHVNDCVTKDGNSLQLMYEFAEVNGIHDIHMLGDGIENINYVASHPEKNRELKIDPTPEAQLEYVEKYFPYAPGIRTHITNGNHDIYNKNIVVDDFWKDFINYTGRNDIVITGYEFADLRINNDKIRLIHRVIQKNKRRKQDPYFQFTGGQHTSRIDTLEGVYHRTSVPPLSRISHNRTAMVGDEIVNFYSGFVVSTFGFNSSGKIEEKRTKYYKFDDEQRGRIVPVSCDEYDDIHRRDFSRVRK